MPIIKETTLTNLKTTFNALFQQGLLEAPSQWDKVATLIRSNSNSNTYGWLGKFPSLKEWVGSRVAEDMREYSYQILNKKYESTVEVDRTDIEDDTLGVYAPLMQEMGQAVVRHQNENAFTLLKEGFTNLSYDGQPFFDDTHPVAPNVDGTGTQTDYSNIVNSGVTVNPNWFLLDTSRPLKPLILQERTTAELEAITTTDNSDVFNRDVYPYGVRWRGNFGYGFWQQAVASRDVLNETNFNEAYQKLQEVKGDGDISLDVMPTVLVVPPSLRAAALNIIRAQLIDSGKTNTNFEAAELIVTPYVA